MPRTFILSFITFLLGLGFGVLGILSQNARVQRQQHQVDMMASELCVQYIRAVDRGDGRWKKDEKGLSHFQWNRQYGPRIVVPECE